MVRKILMLISADLQVSFFTKGFIQPTPLAASASAQEQAAHAVLVTAYYNSRKSWLLASMVPDCYAILDNLCGAQTPE
jgi:hypothetical protein